MLGIGSFPFGARPIFSGYVGCRECDPKIRNPHETHGAFLRCRFIWSALRDRRQPVVNWAGNDMASFLVSYHIKTYHIRIYLILSISIIHNTCYLLNVCIGIFFQIAMLPGTFEQKHLWLRPGQSFSRGFLFNEDTLERVGDHSFSTRWVDDSCFG